MKRPAAGKSIALKAAMLATVVKEADDSRQKAADAIGTAITEFKKAAEQAGVAGQEMSEQAVQQPALASVIKEAKETLSVHVFKLRQASAERVLAEMQLSKAAGLSSRIRLREMLAQIMQQAQLTMPKEIADTTLDSQLKQTMADADAGFKEAADQLADIIDGPGSDSIAMSTKKAASISRIFLLYDQQQLALLGGDKAARTRPTPTPSPR